MMVNGVTSDAAAVTALRHADASQKASVGALKKAMDQPAQALELLQDSGIGQNVDITV